MLNKKLKKLIRDPNLFFSDMVLKQKKKYGHIYTKKVAGHYQYTVVSAVYNVGRYLDDYFKSLVNQRLDFKKHIQLILVDDGSTDNSADIIKSWQKKYPHNITYLKKENGGQASARNLGLQFVKTEWVTFIDPDDKVDFDYFVSVDGSIFSNKNIKMLCCNIIFHIEKNNSLKNSHPLNYKFKDKTIIVPLSFEYGDVQLSASSAFFLLDSIRLGGINFDAEVKPNFEDGKFISEYLMSFTEGNICFVKDAKYIYRKREDGTSTLDTSWEKPERYNNVFEHGYISLLMKAVDKYGVVPRYIQRAVLYELFWYIKHIVKHPERIAFLTLEQKEKFSALMHDTFSYIDEKEIMSFNLAGCWFYHKIGAISFFKNKKSNVQFVYIDGFDSHKNLIKLKYYFLGDVYENIVLDGDSVIPVYTKVSRHDFIDDTFIKEKIVWVNICESKRINISIDDVNTFISLGGKNYKNGIEISDIKKYFKSLIPKYKVNKKYIDSWILMDRDTQADDNAEHLYRYIAEKHPEQPVYFILRRDSHDWERLANDQFKLIEYGSLEHEEALRSCSKLISSHANYYVTNYLGKRMLADRHFIFLQHGVIKDDLSGWLNGVEQIDCFITSTNDEYESIINNDSRYAYGEKEVVLTGLPRHDKLLNDLHKKQNIILIMPTWRQNAVGALTGEGDSRTFNHHFMESNFANAWYNFIHSPKLKMILEKYNYKAIFFPHSNIQPYVSLFDVPEYIDVASHTNGSIQDFFVKASLMITDYSSTAFEMAVQGKATLYYQFDVEECYSGGHTYAKGYYDYQKNGFGIVSTNEDDLLYELEKALSNKCIPDEESLIRIENAFPFRDGKNCERTYSAIRALDEPAPTSSQNPRFLKDYALQASSNLQWAIAEMRWKKYFSLSNEKKDVVHLIRSLREQGKLNEALDLISISLDGCEDKSKLIEEKALVMMAKLKWHSAIECWEEINRNEIDNINFCVCLAFSEQKEKINMVVSGNNDEIYFINICRAFANKDWVSVINLWVANEDVNQDVVEKHCLPPITLLLVSHAYRLNKEYDEAHQCLLAYEQNGGENIFCRYEISSLAFDCHNWKKVISQLNFACRDKSSIPMMHLYNYVRALSKLKIDPNTFLIENGINLEKRNLERDHVYFHACILMHLERWEDAVKLFSSIDIKIYEHLYNLSFCLMRLGEIHTAYTTLINSSLLPSREGLMLRAELAQLNDDWHGAYQSWLEYLHSSPDIINSDNISLLQRLKLISNSNSLSCPKA